MCHTCLVCATILFFLYLLVSFVYLFEQNEKSKISKYWNYISFICCCCSFFSSNWLWNGLSFTFSVYFQCLSIFIAIHKAIVIQQVVWFDSKRLPCALSLLEQCSVYEHQCVDASDRKRMEYTQNWAGIGVNEWMNGMSISYRKRLRFFKHECMNRNGLRLWPLPDSKLSQFVIGHFSTTCLFMLLKYTCYSYAYFYHSNLFLSLFVFLNLWRSIAPVQAHGTKSN